MNTFTVRALAPSDAQALLAFETLNRAWFESQIDPRPPTFYSMEGVAEHIQACLADFAVGVWHPLVIEAPGGRIVGRANLKGINSPEGSAEVGYRIDQQFCGQGLATLALKRLIHEAHARWGLTHLMAYVYPRNIASSTVLQRCGFIAEASEGEPPPGGTTCFLYSLPRRSAP